MVKDRGEKSPTVCLEEEVVADDQMEGWTGVDSVGELWSTTETFDQKRQRRRIRVQVHDKGRQMRREQAAEARLDHKCNTSEK